MSTIGDFWSLGFRRGEKAAASAALANLPAASWPARAAELAPELGSAVWLVTCERAEVYGVGAVDETAARHAAARVLAVHPELEAPIAAVLAWRCGRPAAAHLFQVAAGLDSRLVGEEEIAAQVTAALAAARQGEPRLPPNLDRLGRWALEAGRRARICLDPAGQRRGWVEQVAEKLISTRDAPPWARRRVGLVGTGLLARDLGQRLRQLGLRHLFLYGSHESRTASLATELAASARPREALLGDLPSLDAVLFATRARRPLLEATHFFLPERRQPLCLFDLGEPPLTDPALGALPGIRRIGLPELDGAEVDQLRRAAAVSQLAVELENFEKRLARAFPPNLLAAHGNGDGSPTNRAITALAERLATAIPDAPCQAVFRQGQPSWRDAADVQLGAQEGPKPTVIPLFAADGYFASHVLPRELAASGLLYEMTPALGSHPILQQGLVDQVRQALADHGASNVLVVAHGTTRHPAGARAAARLAARLGEALPDLRHGLGFLDQEPSLEQAAAELAGPGPLLVLPFFLGGDHAEHDVPDRLRRANPRPLVLLPSLLEENMLWPALLAAANCPRGQLRLGTRTSRLALHQAGLVRQALGALGVAAAVLPLSTLGDRDQSRAFEDLPMPGPFTDELGAALRRHDIDVAIHSLKDLPLEDTADLHLAAYLERASPADVLIGRSLAELGRGDRLGTCSRRRFGQLRQLRPDVRALPLRGTIEQRLARLDAGDFEALILAEAALTRLGLAERIRERLPTEAMVPEPGQGTIVLQIRADDARTYAAVVALDHPPTRLAALAERGVARSLEREGLGAVAALARPQGQGPSFELHLQSRLIRDGFWLDAETWDPDPGRAAARCAESLRRRALASVEVAR